jgi:hypothetical protein
MKFLLVSSVSSELLRGLAHEKVKLEPGYAADLFINVEDQWINEASQLDGLKRVQASCGQIATAIIQGSEGDESKVEEYLSTVCNQPIFAKSQQWHKGLCQSFSSHMTSYLERNDAEYNRNYLDVKKICTAFYQDISKVGEVEEKRRDAQAKADKEEEIRKKIEEERKKVEEKEKAKIAAAAKAKTATRGPPKDKKPPRGGKLKKQVIKAHQQDVSVAGPKDKKDMKGKPKDDQKPKPAEAHVAAVVEPKGPKGLKKPKDNQKPKGPKPAEAHVAAVVGPKKVKAPRKPKDDKKPKEPKPAEAHVVAVVGTKRPKGKKP